MENEGEMAPVTKALIAFGLFMVVGFIIVGTTKESDTDKLKATFVHASSIISKMALEKCTEAVYAQTNERVYNPTDSSSDQNTFVELTWRTNGAVKEAICRYEQGVGITLLKYNGRVLESKGINSASPDNTNRSSTATGTHGLNH